MSAYANLHFAFEQSRVRALAALHGSPISDEDDAPPSLEPPRVLVLGPENSGKTSICKILANYCIRSIERWSPIFVNVDTSEVCDCTILASSALANCHTHRADGAFRDQYLRRHCTVPYLLPLLQTLSAWSPPPRRCTYPQMRCFL
jgi:polynucleotide 5'-kinase involved in rRNA processing